VISRVLISKKLLAEFRKQALAAYPNETMSTLWGRIEGETAIVTSLHVPDQKQSNDKVEYNTDDLLSPASVAREHYIGTCHSHPDCADCAPSQIDWDTSYSCGEHLFGIMRIEKKSDGRFKTEVGWYEPRASIMMVHPRIPNANRNNQLEAKSKAVQESSSLYRGEAPSLSVRPVHDEIYSPTNLEEGK